MDYNQNSFDVQDNNLLKKARVVEAVKDGEIKAVREFITQGGDINYCDADNRNSLLHLSVIHDSYNVAVLLLNKGADLTIKNSSGMTALQLAKKLHRDGFILSIQLSIRNRADRELKMEKNRLIMEHSKSMKPANPGLQSLHESTTANLENARSLLRNLESETKKTKKLVKSLENQLIAVEHQIRAAAEAESLSEATDFRYSPSRVIIRCTVCWETPSQHIFQCTEGHVLCEDCFDRPELDLCPECRVPLDQKIRNRALESLITASSSKS